MLSLTTTLIPAISSAYGLCSRLDPFPRRFPATEQTKPPALTVPRSIGASSPPFAPLTCSPRYGKSPSVSS